MGLQRGNDRPPITAEQITKGALFPNNGPANIVK